MEKCWYVIIEGSTLGPFEKEELLSKVGFTPDTLVWRHGFAEWKPAREVEELSDLFRDKKESLPEEEETLKGIHKVKGDEVLAVKSEPPFFLIWLIVILIIILYMAFQLYVNKPN